MELVRPEPTIVPEPGRRKVRLVATRSMYDRGVLTAHSPSLSGLAPGTRMAITPEDLERLGIADGEKVRAIGPRGKLWVEVIADPQAAPGTAHLLWNQTGPDPGDLIDATTSVTDLKLERR
jgi:anaerobic selenocysteine-containing dehydrogenase